jgi:hypothetical protein
MHKNRNSFLASIQKAKRMRLQAGSELRTHYLELTTCYFRENRSKSAICEAISSRAASAAERIP